MSFSDSLLDSIADQLASQGYILLPDALPHNVLEPLLQRAQELREHHFRKAGVGRGQGLQQNDSIRSDEICWLEAKDPREAAYLEWMESLRVGLNRRLFLGLFDFECHFAHYDVGAHYDRHVDAHRGQRNRILSAVCYLNHDWSEDDGGELILYPMEGEQALASVLPSFGTLALFLSEDFPHEVRHAHRPRFSVTGWFRPPRH